MLQLLDYIKPSGTEPLKPLEMNKKNVNIS